MAGEFIPFASTLRTKLSAPAGRTSSQFAPIIPSSAAVSSVPSDQPTALDARAHSHPEVRVDIKRDGERISRITIQCRCGERIELDCEY